MKTMAELKRDAKAGKIPAVMVQRYEDTGDKIPERLRGGRKVVDANSVGITFLNSEGKKSECRIEAASLLEYTDTHITIYMPGLRDLTEEEQRFFDLWETKRDKRKEEIDALSDGNCSYWQQKHFFEDAGYGYLLGFEKQKGMKYDFSTKKVFDNKVKGSIMLKYELCKN